MIRSGGPVIDPQSTAVFVRKRGKADFHDVTPDVVTLAREPDHVSVQFKNGGQYRYRSENIVISDHPETIPITATTIVVVGGRVWKNVVGLRLFTGPDSSSVHVFYEASGDRQYSVQSASEVEVLDDALAAPRPAAILASWAQVVDLLRSDDPVRRPFRRLTTIRPDSALANYLNGAPVTPLVSPVPAIFPFASNVSQRTAVSTSLNYPVSVIDGPPGTGKTQTILNIVASLLASDKTVGIVSYNNAAVENVREKLAGADLGFVAAALGNQDNVDLFLQRQAKRNLEVARLLEAPKPVSSPSVRDINSLRAVLDQAQTLERNLARLIGERSAYMLERSHFLEYHNKNRPVDLSKLPLLAKSSKKMLDYVIETALDPSPKGTRGAFRRVGRYFRYGSTAALDPDDVGTVLQLQQAYYDARLAELDQEIARGQRQLEKQNLRETYGRLEATSHTVLNRALQARYRQGRRRIYSTADWGRTDEFWSDYPVILSTCHSLRANLRSGQLLDVLVVDEASQVNLLTSAIALACARQVIIIGDLRQLPQIADSRAAPVRSVHPAYDYASQSLLSSAAAVFGGSLPRTMLREHYRCHPAIIGYCNQKFYQGELIPFTNPDTQTPALLVWRSEQGGHMRSPSGGSAFNQREVDMILHEVLPRHAPENHDIGITTPYRAQVNKLVEQLLGSVDADTVHRYQGRERDVIIMTTVLDDSRRGRMGVGFVDDPHLVNVAVSRAKKQFILVTHHAMLPTSRNLKDLISYILYQNVDEEVTKSEIVSIFDLLYRDYSQRLEPLSRRLLTASRYKSENIAATMIDDVLQGERYAGLRAASQVLLKNVFLDSDLLNTAERTYIRNRASFDFVIYNAVTLQPILGVEVDGFKYHENDSRQQGRDRLKDSICQKLAFQLLRLPTTGSDEELLLRGRLDSVWPGS